MSREKEFRGKIRMLDADIQPTLEDFKVCGIVELAAPVGVPPKPCCPPIASVVRWGSHLGRLTVAVSQFAKAFIARLAAVVVDTLIGEMSVI